MGRYVYDFAEGNKDQKDLLGGKGANLAEMTRLGLPVPPGFTITTDACKVYLRDGHEPDELAAEIDEHLARLEERMGRRLGDPADPLLVSVRSGAKFSMPGMMDTVLNIGLNERSVVGLASQSGNERFAWDSYRRLLSMFGQTVLGLHKDVFEDGIDRLKAERSAATDLDLTADDLRELSRAYEAAIREHAGRDFPQEPREQLGMAVRAVFDSWNTERATIYRRRERIPADLGTAVNVGTMVFGNGGMDSGTGVAFTRDPATGAQGVYGDYLQNAQGEDVVAGIRNTVPLADLETIDKPSFDELMGHMETLERHYRDLCDIEFTIEHGRLWMLQTRVGKRTAQSAAVWESKTTFPTAAPGEAFMPTPRRWRSCSLLNCGNISVASCAPFTRCSASSMSTSPSSTSSTAIRNAAWAVRLPTRVWSIQSLSFSTVNSMSHMSR